MKLKRFFDINGNNNRGWIDHRVVAYIDNNKVGHITISYIPRERFSIHYRDVLDYIGNIKGGPQKTNPITIDYIKAIYWHTNCNYDYAEANRVLESIPKMDSKEKYFLLRKLKKENFKKFKKEFIQFKKYWVDFPIVNYSEVNLNYRRRKIATLLYLEAGQWMKELGLKLHSSTLQRDNSVKDFWKYLCGIGAAESIPKRKCDKGLNRFVII